MKLIIHDQLKVSEIQEIFSKQFPHLKLEFFVFKPGEKKVFSKKHILADTRRKAGEIRDKHHSAVVSINGNQKVSTLEYNFLKDAGLNVQVFRHAGKNWLETSASDSWSLSQQNKVGMQTKMQGEGIIAPDFDAYHEQV